MTAEERRLRAALTAILDEATKIRHSWEAVAEARAEIARLASEALDD